MSVVTLRHPSALDAFIVMAVVVVKLSILSLIVLKELDTTSDLKLIVNPPVVENSVSAVGQLNMLYIMLARNPLFAPSVVALIFGRIPT